MARFIVKRIFEALITLFIIATITFFLMNIIPGGPFNTERASAKTVAMMEAKYGLDKPLGQQYLIYMKRLVRLDFGDSYKRAGFTVNQILGEKFPVSAKVGAVAILISVLIGIPVGIIAAFNHNKPLDRTVMFIANLGIAVPNFVMATAMMFLFAVRLGWLPIMGLKTWKHYIMPALALSFNPMCYISRLMRSSMLDVLKQDYVKTANAKGLTKNKVLYKHAMRNAVLPVVTYLGPLTAGILTGGFVIEKIFTIPGMGKFFVESINNRDYPLIMGVTIFYSALLVLMNLIVDLLYGIIDPRIKYE